MKTSRDIRFFYDTLYKRLEEDNPAYAIYDRLRANYIGQLVRGCLAPVLIVGCGSRRDFSIVSELHPVYAFDLSFEAVNHAPPVAYRFTADALNIPFSASHFKLVICSEVLEHIPDIHSAVSELRRVLCPDGVLIVSSPNWISWFGLARWTAKKFTGKDITSNRQPYDDWKTFNRYKNELNPEFEVVQSRGVWYMPPLHYRRIGIPGWLMKAFYFFYSPAEYIQSRLLPKFGHLLILKCKPTQK